MERIARKPFQGVINIVRFNRHFYLFALTVIFGGAGIAQFLSGMAQTMLNCLLMVIVSAIVVSLTASAYIYDMSSLYSFNWLYIPPDVAQYGVINIHAGFDETSEILRRKFPDIPFTVFDFYNPEHHTEISLERARKAYPAFPGTQRIQTNKVPIQQHAAGAFLLLFAAHEIRRDDERIAFFQQLQSALHPNGRIIVAEHLRDWKNFLVYTVGFFHFHSRKTWERTFTNADLAIVSEQEITPFITIFTLCSHETSSDYHWHYTSAAGSGTPRIS